MYPGQIASFIAPADHAWSETAAAPPPMTAFSVPSVTDEAIAKTAQALRQGDVSALFLGGRALRADALWQAGRIAAATGARLISETFCARIQRGAGRVPVERLPYFGEQAAEFLQDISTLVVVGSKAPVSFFAYPNKPSYLAAETADVSTLADVRHDALDALTRLADALDAPKSPAVLQTQTTHALETGPMNMLELGKVIANHLPEHAIVSDEGATNGMGAFAYTGYSAPHEWLMLTGGAIGQGLPLALGAAVACPDQKVIALQADGGAMYTVQSLWTMVRENLDVTVVLLNNSSYAILNIEMERVGVTNPTEKARSLLDLSNPTIDWVKIAQGMGMAAQRVEPVADFDREFADSMQQQGPRLIEVILPGYTFSNPQG